MVAGGKCTARPEYLYTLFPQPLEGLGRCNLMNIVPVYVKLGRAVFKLLHHMGIPYFVEKCLTCRHTLYEFRYCVYKCLHSSRYYIGIGGETIIEIASVLDLHMHLSHIVAAACYRLH